MALIWQSISFIIRFSKTKIQAFLEAVHPVQQFTFRIKFWKNDDEKIECEGISNGKTGEKLSIAYLANSCFDHTLEIKRSEAEKKKDSKNGGK